MPTLFILQTLLPSRRRDCLPFHRTSLSPRPLQKNDNPSLAPTLPKPHYPSPRTKLASLVKGEVLSPEKNSGDYRRDCLITISRLHQPSQTRTILRLTPTSLPPLSKVRCCRPIKFGRRPEGLPHHHPSPRTNPSKTALYHPLFVLQSSVCAYTILLLNYPTRFS